MKRETRFGGNSGRIGWDLRPFACLTAISRYAVSLICGALNNRLRDDSQIVETSRATFLPISRGISTTL